MVSSNGFTSGQLEYLNQQEAEIRKYISMVDNRSDAERARIREALSVIDTKIDRMVDRIGASVCKQIEECSAKHSQARRWILTVVVCTVFGILFGVGLLQSTDALRALIKLL